jgi:hypothetical protein
MALRNIFHNTDLVIYDVEMTPMQGGSLRIFLCHKDEFSISQNVTDLVNEEIQNDYDKIETYKRINENIEGLKDDLISLLNKIKGEGKRIAGYGAPAKGIVLLNYFGIGTGYLDFIVDKSEAKQGLYMPGTHLFIYPPEKVCQEKPDYLLILCWNLAEEVMEQLKDYEGKFIIPIPKLWIQPSQNY